MSFLTLSTPVVSRTPSVGLSVRCSAQPSNVAPSQVSMAPTSRPGGLSQMMAASQNIPLSFGPAAFAPVQEASVIDPSSAFANVMWGAAASKTFNTQILVGETESTESVVRRFKKVCMDANIVQECRRRRYFETKQDIAKRKVKDNARKRKRFQRTNGPRPNFFANKEKPEEKAAAPVEDDDDAVWSAM